MTSIAQITAWDQELLAEEDEIAAGLGDVEEYIECLQHFVQVAGRNGNWRRGSFKARISK